MIWNRDFGVVNQKKRISFGVNYLIVAEKL